MARATSISGSNILEFDGSSYARTVASEAERLHGIDKDLAMAYLKSMENLTVKMENCEANFDNSDHHYAEGEKKWKNTQ